MPKSTVEHGTPKAPSPKSSTEGKTPTFTSQNTNRGKLIRMGRNPPVRAPGRPTTGA